MRFEIEFENNPIEFIVQYGKRKKISLQIDSFGAITVKAPKDTSNEVIISSVEHHGKWILEKLRSHAKAREAPKAKEYQDEGKFPHLNDLRFNS